MKQELDPSPLIRDLVETHFSGLRKTVRKNLARLSDAFLRLAVGVRFGYGGLHLTSIARVLPGGGTFKSNYKWLSRFLKNRYFDPPSLAECMLALILGRRAPPWTLVLFDQTTINGVQVVNAAIPLEGRAVPVRHRHVLYHGQQQEPVDVIVYRGQGFQDAWFLIVPPGSESWLPTAQVVRLYAERMQIEQCFRDWKSHLGLRGLHLEIERTQRLLRLLMAFTLPYLLTLLLGQDPLAEKARPYFEAQRRTPRHGTRRVLSVLSIAIYMLADARWQERALRRFQQILTRLACGRGVALPPVFPP